ncbi:MAG: hypothetical protein ACSLFN_15960 [Candidatus Limnocylindrales bacterium]
MHTRSRHLLFLAFSVIAAVAAACGPGGASPDTTIGATTGPTSAAPTPILSAGPVEPGVSGAPPASQTETEWGTIWDGVPAGFPRFPGGRSADDATAEPVSDAYAVADVDPAEIASTLQTTMENATYSTEGLSGPLEDGRFVLASVGDAGCRIETRIVPQGNQVFVMVRYGAACPAA